MLMGVVVTHDVTLVLHCSTGVALLVNWYYGDVTVSHCITVALCWCCAIVTLIGGCYTTQITQMWCHNYRLSGLLGCYAAGVMFFMILSTGMHPVLFVVHLWEKGSSHWPEPVLWRRDCLHLTSGRGLNYTHALAAISWTLSIDLPNTVNKKVRKIFSSSMFVVSNSSTSNSRFQDLLKEWDMAKSGMSTSFQNLCYPTVRQHSCKYFP